MAVIMGVLNMTPDSFYEGSRLDISQATDKAHEMVEAGASILDIGGESTRPGAIPVSVAQECDRVLPILEILAKDFKNITLSIDTRNPEVMLKAIDAGANLINDINALQGDIPLNLLEKIKQKSVSVCLMHMQGQPQTMQWDPVYLEVLSEVKNFLEDRRQFCLKQGIKEHQLIIDPGFGFGKTADHNAILLKNLGQFKTLGCQILVGLSRKSFIGKWLETSNSPLDRLEGSLAAAVIAVLNGADIIRTHDVKATAQVVKIATRFQS